MHEETCCDVRGGVGVHAAGAGGVVQESLGRVGGELVAEERGHEQEVVVVHPDEVAWAQEGGDGACVGCVGGTILLPVRRRRGLRGDDVLPKEVVEEWPERCK